MPQGVSTTENCTKMAARLAKDGVDFVARYYFSINSRAKTKLTFNEAQALSKAGVGIVAIYEDVANSASAFSFNQGHAQGFSAYSYAKNIIHQAPGSAIYFAVDFDAASTDISGAVNDYFAGLEQGFADAALGTPVYDIGVYGSGLCCLWLRTHRPAVRYAWLAESTGWAGSSGYANWNIKQSIMPAPAFGFDPDEAETNTTAGAYGAFTVLT